MVGDRDLGDQGQNAVAQQEAERLNNQGNRYLAGGQMDAAIDAFHSAIRLRPAFVEAYYNLGNAYLRVSLLDEARGAFETATKLRPDFALAHLNLGNLHRQQGNTIGARECYLRAVAHQPNCFPAWHNLGVLFQQLGEWQLALDAYKRAIEGNPRFCPARNNLGCLYLSLARYAEATEEFRQVVELSPEAYDGFLNLGMALQEQGEWASAIQAYQEAYRRKPEAAVAALVHAKQHACDWHELEELSSQVIDLLERRRTDGTPGRSNAESPIFPFSFLGLPIPTSSEQQWKCARDWSARFPTHHPPLHGLRNAGDPHDEPRRLRIGYLSADFRIHAMGHAMVEVFEAHDRSAFEIFGYSIGPDDRSDLRQRIVKSFDTFRDFFASSHREAAERIAADRIDILVDLQGHTRGARSEILAYRPAPIQVNYLGYPGTMGAPFIDYILVDSVIVPSDRQAYYTERLLSLPGCYQANASRPTIAKPLPSRRECDLPEQGLVFASFNNSYKYHPQTFSSWMRLLDAIPGSVLWLLETTSIAEANLRREARHRGIDPRRLVFAPYVSVDRHLARQPLADLFLDTFPYNAHTTASMALRMGVPVITRRGESFASRVAASLLEAVGLPELITDSDAGYYDLALLLGASMADRCRVRDKLARNLEKTSLFDSRQLVARIETAFRSIWSRNLDGEPPPP